jgi:hypothetical protein
MLSALFFNQVSYGFILGKNLCNISPINRWLVFGKLPENPVVTPTSSVQVIQPSAENKFLQSVTVNAIPTTTTEG